MALETQREFSPNLYDDLRDRLRAKDQEQAIALTYELICSGRPLSEIIAETAPPVRRRRFDVVPDPGRPTASHSTPTTVAGTDELRVEDRTQVLPLADLEPGSTEGARLGANGPDLGSERPGAARTAHKASDIPGRCGRWAADDPPSPARPASTTAALPPAALPNPEISIARAGHRSDAWRRSWRIGFLAAYGALLVASAAFGFLLLHRITLTAPAAEPAAGASAKVPSSIKSSIGPTAGVPRTRAVPAEIALAASIVPFSHDAAKSPVPSSAESRAEPVSGSSQPAPALPSEIVKSSADATASPPEPEKSTAHVARPPLPASAANDAAAARAAVSHGTGPATATAADGAGATPRAAGPLEVTAETLVARGDALLGTRDVATARLFYRRASDRGDSAAALRLGETFDTAFLRQAGLGSVTGDPATARYWYRRARDLGNPDAELLLKSLKPAER